MTETYYDRLGITPKADQSTIKQAWQRAVKEKHPDQNDDPDAQQQFIQVKEAYDVLSDPDERERYDRLGHEQYLADRQHGGTDTGDAYERDRTARDGTDEQGRATTEAGNVDWGAHTRGHEAAEHVWKAGSGPTADTAPPTDTAHAGLLQRLLAYGAVVLVPGYLSLMVLAAWIAGSAAGTGSPVGLGGGLLSSSVVFTVVALAVTYVLIAGAEWLLETERRVWSPL
jgi:hypothetical protein